MLTPAEKQISLSSLKFFGTSIVGFDFYFIVGCW
jgi:hypothetical protein